MENEVTILIYTFPRKGDEEGAFGKIAAAVVVGRRGLEIDGAMAAVDAKALAYYGTDRFGMKYPVHLTAWGFGQMSALLSYLMVPATY